MRNTSILAFLPALLSSFACLSGMGSVAAQDFPIKPVRIVTGSGAGGSIDTAVRIIATEMSKILGQQVIVENKTGANQVIAYTYVAKQVPADGYVIAAVSIGSMTSLPLVTKDLQFDPLKDLPPLIDLGEGRLLLASPSAQPWKTLKDVVAYGKANPGKLNYGASASSLQLYTVELIRALGLNAVYVPYGSSGAAYMLALAKGEIHLGLIPVGGSVSLREKYQPLAVTGGQRRAPYLDIPTFAELGYPQIRGNAYSLNLPVGVPKRASDKLYAAASLALKQPWVIAGYQKLQLDIINDTSEAAAIRLAREAKLFADIAKNSGIKLGK